MAALDSAVRMVTRAVHLDEAKRYSEAAACYRAAIADLKKICASPDVSPRVSSAISEKCALYEQRLRKLHKHLLSKADLTDLFRKVVLEENGSVKEPTSRDVSDAVQIIARAKRQDAKGRYESALHLYEQGASLLLSALRKRKAFGGDEDRIDAARIKCLLVHERCEVIRDHLEQTGASLKKSSSESSLGETMSVLSTAASVSSLLRDRAFESEAEDDERSLKHFEEARNLPLIRQHVNLFCRQTRRISWLLGASVPQSHKAAQMEHWWSNVVFSLSHLGLDRSTTPTARMFSSVSMHSLYPTCVEIRRPESVVSGQSDFAVAEDKLDKLEGEEHSVMEDLREEENGAKSIPLADLSDELRLSSFSLASKCSSRPRLASASSSVASSRASSSANLNLMRVCVDVHDVNDVIDVQDCVHEEEDLLKELLLQHSVTPGPKSDHAEDEDSLHWHDGASDSGFSDRSHGGTLGDASNSNSHASVHRRSSTKSPMSDIDSLDIVPSLPVPSPEALSPLPAFVMSPSPTPSAASLRTSSTGGRRRHRVRLNSDSVVVLSEEEVVVEKEVYSKASPTKRQEYIPPRSVAARRKMATIDEDEEFNKGCYTFVSCMDSMWIL